MNETNMTKILNKHKQSNTPLKRKVFVGMSGGVDSSVSAALLKKEGFDVTGVFIKVWQPDWITCTWKEDRLDAMRVAAELHIPFMTLDLEKEYKKEVVDYMIREYKAGRTPNPDVMCNKFVKFGSFYEWAMIQGGDFVSTGHYAQIKQDALGKYHLLKGFDPQKDQSYFLYTLKQRQLPKIIFPVGGMTKDKVRKLARKFKLFTAEKKDSQGLCFIGKIDMKEFLSRYLPLEKGAVLNTKGEVIGEHRGASLYTIGERHGFLINKKTPKDSPLYVASKDIEANTLTVAVVESLIEQHEKSKDIILEETNWIVCDPKPHKKYSARIRYRQALIPCGLKKENEKWALDFDFPQKAISPGQSAVIYDGDSCIGGGIIM